MNGEGIGARVGKDRATVYRWLSLIKKVGIREFVRCKKECKRRRQPRKFSPEIKNKIKEIRREFDWCGEKIQKELLVSYELKVSLMGIYRVLKEDFKVSSKWKRYKHRGEAPVATGPRQIVQHDTVNFGELFAFTSIDIFTKEPVVIMATDLMSKTGVMAFKLQQAYFGKVALHQSDEGSEFQGDFPATVRQNGALHRYSRPYRKNDQAFIENFNRSLRKECLGWGKYRKEDLGKVQARVDRYIQHFIYRRWHMGLPNMQTPHEFRTMLCSISTKDT
jgi:transposase InsO family protein